LDSNSFNGSIPASINKIRGLILLNLTKNKLSGEIPKEIGLISGMQELYLSHNNLSGHIPESFENMSSLHKLDLSFNQLDGEVPTHGVFSNMTQFSLDGESRALWWCLRNTVAYMPAKLHGAQQRENFTSF
jgi:Leucine-rich repeat (LRR) protein